MTPKYKRILLKLSGETLGGEQGSGFEYNTIRAITESVISVHNLGVEVGIVVDGPFAIEKMTTRMEELHDLLSPYVVGADGEQAPYSLLDGFNAFETSLTSNNNGLILHVETRHQLVEEALQSISN